MRFKPSTEDEIAAGKLWPKGFYAFQVIEAEEKVSASKGNPMIELTIELTRPDGTKRLVKDYLLPQRPEKLLHAATTCGVQDKYFAGVLSEDDFVGKRGRLEIGLEKSKDYPTKNVVKDYL
jgi:hypothetical protein